MSTIGEVTQLWTKKYMAIWTGRGLKRLCMERRHAPRDVMGPRITQDGVLIQGFFPDAEEVDVISGEKTYAARMEDEAGYFAVLLPDEGAGISDFL